MFLLLFSFHILEIQMDGNGLMKRKHEKNNHPSHRNGHSEMEGNNNYREGRSETKSMEKIIFCVRDDSRAEKREKENCAQG